MPIRHSPLSVPLRLLGLTGPAGGGKTFLLALFCEAGVATAEADALYADLVRPGAPLLARIAAEFGPEVVTEAGTLDRELLAATVFAGDEARRRLDAIAHPALRDAVRAWCETVAREGSREAVLEAAVLFEAGLAAECDEVWFVDSPADVRSERLARSRGWAAERIERLLLAQEHIEARREQCSRVIDGTAARENLALIVRSWVEALS
jgi:dephospho-CoA kinase